MSLVYFDLSIGGSNGRLVFRLYDEYVPKTAANFRSLCQGNAGNCKSKPSIPLSYKGCPFHRIISGFMAQGGDFTAFNGTGGESIYGRKFEDESFRMKHNKAGLLSMANSGPNTNGSQFFITFRPVPHLDGKHVVFGEVVDGMNDLKRMEIIRTDSQDKPVSGQEIIIVDCGVIGGAADSKKASRKQGIESPEISDNDRNQSKKTKSSKKEKKSKDKKSKSSKKSKKRARSPSTSSRNSDIDSIDSVRKISSTAIEVQVATSSIEPPKVVEKREPPPPRIGSDGTVYKGRGTMKYQQPSYASRHYQRSDYHDRGRVGDRDGARSRGRSRSIDSRDARPYRGRDDRDGVSAMSNRHDSRDREGYRVGASRTSRSRSRDRPVADSQQPRVIPDRDVDDVMDKTEEEVDKHNHDRQQVVTYIHKNDNHRRADSRDRDRGRDRRHYDDSRDNNIRGRGYDNDYRRREVSRERRNDRPSRFDRNIDPRAKLLATERPYAKTDLDYHSSTSIAAAALSVDKSHDHHSKQDDAEKRPSSPIYDRLSRRRSNSSVSSSSSSRSSVSSGSSDSSYGRRRRRRSSS